VGSDSPIKLQALTGFLSVTALAVHPRHPRGYSTVGDLLKFANALMTRKLLTVASTDLLIAGKVEARGRTANLPMGLRISATRRETDGWAMVAAHPA